MKMRKSQTLSVLKQNLAAINLLYKIFLNEVALVAIICGARTNAACGELARGRRCLLVWRHIVMYCGRFMPHCG